MPAVSKKQFKFMEAIKHGGIKKPGLSPEKAAEYVSGGHKQYESLPETHKLKFKKTKKLMGGK
jgi:hypothetical protein